MIDEIHIMPINDVDISHVAEHNCPCGVQIGMGDGQIVYLHFDADERALANVS